MCVCVDDAAHENSDRFGRLVGQSFDSNAAIAVGCRHHQHLLTSMRNGRYCADAISEYPTEPGWICVFCMQMLVFRFRCDARLNSSLGPAATENALKDTFLIWQGIDRIEMHAKCDVWGYRLRRCKQSCSNLIVASHNQRKKYNSMTFDVCVEFAKNEKNGNRFRVNLHLKPNFTAETPFEICFDQFAKKNGE